MKLLFLFSLLSVSLWAAEEVHAVSGTVQAIDRAAKTVAVRTADGAEYIFHVASKAAVHGAGAIGRGSASAFDALKTGDEVVVHYTVRGAEKTGEEFDRIGREGLHVVEGTGQHIDRAAKTISIKTADGTIQTFHFTDRLAKETGEDTARGTEKAAKVTVYYTEDAGRKIAHFFRSE
ncbi:MAG TPA: hypothetical protein VKX39_03075 [Bryobacteraceae bacterium]|nr:hypothetical protein [Bryobacteraceae bacterium]